MGQGPELGVELGPQLVRAAVPRPAQVQRELGERLDSDIFCTAHDELPPSVSSVRKAACSRRSNRALPERRDDESGLAPTLESPTQRMNTLEAVGGQPEGHPGARGLLGLRAVEDHFAVSWDQF